MHDHTILTASGQEVSLTAPDPRMLDIESTAHALSTINRFTGHACRPYSVAEHSLLVSEIIRRAGGGTIAQLCGLLHDAHEQLVGDVSSPVKAEMRRYAAAGAFEARQLPAAKTWSHYDRVDACAQGAVRIAFGILAYTGAHEHLVHAADMIALATERRDLMPAHPAPWPCLDGIQPADVDLMESGRASFGWQDWRDAFIDRYQELRFELDQFERPAGSSAA